ncbi:class I glutamine amidotransferase-like protein [Dipodascopsis uninucleata]
MSPASHKDNIIKIAILETDPDLETPCGTFTDLFVSLFSNAATEEEEKLEHIRHEITAFNVVKGCYPDPEEFDGILITGSRADAYDNQSWIVQLADFIRRVYDQSLSRLVGICFGHQIISRALGGNVEPNSKGWEIAVTEIEVDQELKDTLFPGESIDGRTLRLQEMHRDHVSIPPRDIHVFGRTERSPVQGFFVGGRLLTFQGHPEFNKDVTVSLVNDLLKNGKITSAEAEDAISRAQLKNHGNLAGKAIIRFLTSSD